MSLARFGLAVVLALHLAQAQGALALKLAGDLNPAQQAASYRLIEQTQALLPKTLSERLDRSVTLRWQLLPKSVLARSNGRALVEINSRLLPALARGQAAYQVAQGRHPNAEQELVASLLHELLHLYDRARWLAKPSLMARCARRVHSQGSVGLPEPCIGQSHRRFSLSDDPAFLALAGWPDTATGRSSLGQRPIEPYELVNPREFAAVNFEHFVLDPQYACRKPLLDQFFRAHFKLAAKACAEPLLYLNAGGDFKQNPLAQLDPKRIYQVDYLLADSNANWASRFGHSMLRLVICAPNRPLGPDCRRDVDQHLVLSFRAFVDDLQLSSWRGVNGSYPSRLFILPLDQVVDEYTKVELRGLNSLPLKLSRAEIERLAAQAAQLHWQYQGRYFFFTNNCASETLKLLRVALGDGRLAAVRTPLPTGVLQQLAARNLADLSVLEDSAQALRLGYRFASDRERLAQMLAVLRRELLPLPHKQTVEDWLDQPALQRRQFIAKANLKASAALLLLEQAAQRRRLLGAQQALKERYLEGAHPELGQADELLRALLEDSVFLSQPARLLDSGYGLAQREDWTKLEHSSEQRRLRLLALDQQLESLLQKLLPKDVQQELSQGRRNLQLISQQLRRLHRAKGGFSL